jgi:penicillin-binding protein 1B
VLNRWTKLAAGAGTLLLIVIGILAVPYNRLARRVDRQLTASRSNSINFYSAPELIEPGDPLSSGDLVEAAKRAGEPAEQNNRGVTINSAYPAEIDVANGRVASIMDLATHRALPNYQLQPQLLADESEAARAKRIPVSYSEIPPVLVHAILSAEDKRFFHHSGLDMLRLSKALYVDIKERRKEQGASTISMQLARKLCLRRDKSWKRKLEEALITIHLEHELSKQKIFERYCNLVYLGGTGAFGITGVGEAAQAYFNKDVPNLSLPEAATIAGLIQRPVYLNPFRYPSRAVDRRNVVLKRMLANGYITSDQFADAAAAHLGLHAGATTLSESQYFVDAAAKDVAREAGDDGAGATAAYTTLDLRLQRAAEDAVAEGMRLVDKQLAARRSSSRSSLSRSGTPQVALIAIDPHTGHVLAFCGGRNYAASQLDRVFAKRPPGSVFKPFVYTAALNTAISGGDPVLTPASMVDDSPTTFDDGDQTYSPSNFKQEFMGEVTLRQALAHSLNVAAVKVARMVGYRKVVAIAREAGMNEDIEPTPAVALGAYQVTPFEIARAYTMFANGGTLVQPAFIRETKDSSGAVLYRNQTRLTRVLDPRVAFLMVDMLQEVMRSGTAAGVRARGFRLPAAGKTGTSHDGWFAGFTSQLLCVVWVGFDDYKDLGLEGARSALPIWTQFMSEAARYKQYGDAKPFKPPEGVTRVAVDPQSGMLAGPDCGPGVPSYFVAGTEPQTQCAPEEVQITSTPGGGIVEQSVPMSAQPPIVPDAPPLNPPAQDLSVVPTQPR